MSAFLCFVVFVAVVVIVVGDFNFHFEKVESNKSRRKLHDIIDMFNLTQSVSEPTHNQGHNYQCWT